MSNSAARPAESRLTVLIKKIWASLTKPAPRPEAPNEADK